MTSGKCGDCRSGTEEGPGALACECVGAGPVVEAETAAVHGYIPSLRHVRWSAAISSASIVVKRSDHDPGSELAFPRTTINDKVVSDPVDRYEPVRPLKTAVPWTNRSTAVDEIVELLCRGRQRVLVLDFVAVPIESAQ
jgi:hypothetical protein